MHANRDIVLPILSVCPSNGGTLSKRMDISSLIMPPLLGQRALSDDAHLTSDVCLSVTYIGPKSRTERPRKTKIDPEVAHVTRDSDTTFKVKRSKVNLQGAGAYCGGFPHSLLHCALSCGAVYCNRPYLWVGGSVITITRNCVHRSSPNWVYR